MKTIQLVLAAAFILCGNPNSGIAGVPTATPGVTQDPRGETVYIPHSAPEMSNFLLVTFLKTTSNERLVAIVALYDDLTTRRKLDYAQIYGGSGHLLGIAWLDEFGIRRIAVDFGLIDEDSVNVTGVLVLVDEGTLVQSGENMDAAAFWTIEIAILWIFMILKP